MCFWANISPDSHKQTPLLESQGHTNPYTMTILGGGGDVPSAGHQLIAGHQHRKNEEGTVAGRYSVEAWR